MVQYLVLFLKISESVVGPPTAYTMATGVRFPLQEAVTTHFDLLRGLDVFFCVSMVLY